MSPAAHEPSYYAATAHPFPDCLPLSGQARADVCVVGGGITGIATALELAEHGYKVIVLEAERVGWGATGRNGGQLLTGYACGQEVLEAQLGAADARRLWDFSVEAVDIVRRNVAHRGIDCDLTWGALSLALKPRQVGELRQWQAEMAERYGYEDLEFVPHGDLHKVIGSDRFRAAVLDHGGGHLHPLNYCLGLARAAQAAGAVIHEGSRVVRLHEGDKPWVETATGRVDCDTVVLAGNAYIGSLSRRLWSRIMPVGTYVATTEPLGAARAGELLPGNACASDVQFVLDYFRRSADHRLLFGGLVSYSTLPPRDVGGALRRRMVNVFPQLAGVRIDHAWGGFVDITMNRGPDFGRLSPTVYYAQGFSGHGLALTNVAGRILAEAIRGQHERLDVFERLRHRAFPGGPWLRTPALVLGNLYYRFRDLLP